MATPPPGLNSRYAPLNRPLTGSATTLADTEVAAFLRANPGFLAANPALYRALVPPARVHGARMADHMAAMLRAEREHAAAMAARADDVLAAGRAAAGLAARVQDAVVALLRASDPVDCISTELPALLGIDAASLCVENHRPGARVLPAGTIERLLSGRAVVLRAGGADARMLHGEAAGLACAEALVRVPDHAGPTLVALVARDAATLDPAQGAGALTFLGRAVAAALER